MAAGSAPLLLLQRRAAALASCDEFAFNLYPPRILRFIPESVILARTIDSFKRDAFRTETVFLCNIEA